MLLWTVGGGWLRARSVSLGSLQRRKFVNVCGPQPCKLVQCKFETMTFMASYAFYADGAQLLKY